MRRSRSGPTKASSSTPTRLQQQLAGHGLVCLFTSRGNYDGEYAPFTNIGADPNISAAYDYYEFFTNGTD